MKVIIFTDLDGTLVDHATYSFEPALPALSVLKEKEVPVILCTSKTRKEIEYFREKLGNRHPFISENGGGVFIPDDYFSAGVMRASPGMGRDGDYRIIRLGADYSSLRKALIELRGEGFDVTGFGDMSVAEVAAVTGLDAELARMAKERDFDEPFLFNGSNTEVRQLGERIAAKGFSLTQGVFFHILGGSDKGKAMEILIRIYREAFGEITTVALGDSPNDIPMLERAGCPVLVQKPDGRHDPRVVVPKLVKVEGIGPEGWNRAVLELVSRLLR